MDGDERTRLIREIVEIATIISQRRGAMDLETRWAICLLDWCIDRRLSRLQRRLRATSSGRER